MGIIKDLRVKVAKGVATDEEKAQLEELENEAKAPEATDEEAVDKMAASLLEKVNSMIEEKTKSLISDKTEIKNEKALDKGAFADMTKEQKIGEFIKALYTADRQKLQVLSEGSSALGGYLVPSVWYDKIVEEMREDAVIRSKATVIPVTTNTFYIDQLATRPKAQFRSEKAVKSTSTAEWSQISLTPYSLACIVPLSQELVDDASIGTETMVSMITRLITEAIAEKEDQAFMTGSGSGQPTGIDNYSGTVGRSVTTAANVVTADALISAYYKLGSRYRRNAYWIMNSLTLTKVMQLKDGQNKYLFIPDPTGATTGTLLGRPVLEQNDLTQARIWFGDLKGYYIAVREGMSVKVSDEATVASNSAFEKNLVFIRVEERIDGEMADTNAFVVINGTN